MSRFRHSIISALAVFACAWVAACQGVREEPPAMSLEEAKAATATFETPLAVPPRTTDDVLALLERSASPASEMARLRARAEAKPLAGADERALVRFLRDRAHAALVTGRPRRAVEDYERALVLGRAAGIEPAAERGLLRALVVAHRDLGRYRRAVRLAEELVAMTPRTEALGFISNLSALYFTLGDVGELERAGEAIEEAARFVPGTYAGRGGAMWGAVVRMLVPVGRGEVAFHRGAFEEAESHFREALAVIDGDIAGNPQENVVNPRGETREQTQVWMKHRVHAWLARTLVRQGRLVEAEAHARQAIVGYAQAFGRDSARTARGLQSLALVLTEQGRFDEAERLARVVIDVYRRMGASEEALTMAQARRDLADVFVGQHRFGEAAALHLELEHAVRGDADVLRHLRTSNLNWAPALIEAGRTKEALSRLSAVERHLAERLGPKHYAVAEAGGLRACALAAEGRLDEARAGLGAAVPVLLRRSRAAHGRGSSRSMTDRRLEYVLECALRVLARAPGPWTPGEVVSETFLLAEQARTRSVQRALGAAAARARLGSPELEELARREQDAQNRIAALHGLMVQVVTQSEDSRATVRRLRVEIDRLRGARGTLMAEIERRFPDYAALVDPKALTVAAVQGLLAPGEALVATYVGEHESYVWAVPRTGDAALAVLPMGRAEVDGRVRRLRAALAPDVHTLGDIPDFDVAGAHALYRALLAPVAGSWRGAERLLVVPHGALAQLPFAVLVTEPAELPAKERALFARYREVPWLARGHAISVLPSVTSLASLRAVPAGAPSRRPFVGFADPLFLPRHAVPDTSATVAASGTEAAPATRSVALRRAFRPRGARSATLGDLPRLPDTADEVREIARALGAELERDLYLGRRASEQAVKSAPLARYRVVAFATHGLVPGDLDGLRQPALALTSPVLGGGEGDGLLTMSEVLALRLDADWVVLSACNTAAAEGEGAEAFSGLGRSFFYAGSRAVLLSNWPVETSSARALTTDLFRRQAADPNLRRDEALAQAALALIDGPGHVDPASGLVVFSYAHPIFWAPFSLVGDGRP